MKYHRLTDSQFIEMHHEFAIFLASNSIDKTKWDCKIKILKLTSLWIWKLSPNSNSGFMWGVNESKDYDAPYLTGPEIQIIDADIYAGDEKNQIHTTGSLYDMIAPDHVMAKPAGEWNSYHIVINHEENKGTVNHNGMIINRFPLHGTEWDEMIENSKFKDISGFGKFKEGHLCLQDHPGVISYKNIKIRKL